MSVKVSTAPPFERNFRRLKRKHPRIDEPFGLLVEELQDGEQPGDKISGVGYDVYKVRLRNPSAGKSKRGGFRVIYYIRLADHIVLLTIYSKSDQTDISADQIRRLIEVYIPTNDTEDGDTE